MADLRKYCPACLDKWATPTKWAPDVTKRIARPPLRHDSCREALEKICYGNN